MDKLLDLGVRPHVRVERVRRDLRIETHDRQQVRLQAGSDTTEVEHSDGVTTLRSPASVCLWVPADCILEIGHVGGDLAMSGLKSDCHIGQIGGDASFEGSAGLLVDRIGGDCLARQIIGDVSLKAVGGDVVLEALRGNAKIFGAGGDAVLIQIQGDIQMGVGGDATVNLKDGMAGNADISSGGDVYCRLPAEASVAAKLLAGGDLKVTGGGASKADWGEAVFEQAGGEYQLTISAGGDLWLAIGKTNEIPVEMSDLGGTIAAKVGAKIAEMEAALAAMGAELDGVSSDLISERVQKIVDRAMRRQEQVEVGASLRDALERGSFRSQGVSDAERMKVLKLLEAKKISVEQAEELLAALEG